MDTNKVCGNKKKSIKFTTVALTFVLVAFSLIGCNRGNEETQEAAIQKAVEEALKEQEEKNQLAAQEKEPEETGIEDVIDYGYDEDYSDPIFALLSDQLFEFKTGVGDWYTDVSIAEDGSFSGYFEDIETEEYSADYPNGTHYCNNFSGQFSKPHKIDDYTYSVNLLHLDYEYLVDTDEILNGVRIVYTEAYGIGGTESFYIIMKGAPIAELPDGYKGWFKKKTLEEAEATGLPFYGLYNLEMESGFRSYEIGEDVPSDRLYLENEDLGLLPDESSQSLEEQYGLSDTPSIDERIASDEFVEMEENSKLENEDITQSEMNEIAARIYQVWDDELNWVWNEMEASLDETTINTLEVEQKQWLATRDKAMQDAGLVAEGGSMQPLLEWTEGADLTKKRVKELAKWVR